MSCQVCLCLTSNKDDFEGGVSDKNCKTTQLIGEKRLNLVCVWFDSLNHHYESAINFTIFLANNWAQNNMLHFTQLS